MKPLITGLAIAIICAGTGFGAGGILLGTPAQASTDTADHGAPKENHDPDAAEPQYDDHGKLIPPVSDEPVVVEIGRIMVPVYKAKSVSYVIATMAASVKGEEAADHLKTVDGATELRNLIITSMAELASTPLLRDEVIDTHALTESIMKSLHDEFPEVTDLLFLSLIKSDVARG